MIKILLGISIITSFLIGCAQTQTNRVNIANPASVNCLTLGGRLESVKGDNGIYMLCHLLDGRIVEEWTLFKENE